MVFSDYQTFVFVSRRADLSVLRLKIVAYTFQVVVEDETQKSASFGMCKESTKE